MTSDASGRMSKTIPRFVYTTGTLTWFTVVSGGSTVDSQVQYRQFNCLRRVELPEFKTFKSRFWNRSQLYSSASAVVLKSNYLLSLQALGLKKRSTVKCCDDWLFRQSCRSFRVILKYTLVLDEFKRSILTAAQWYFELAATVNLINS